MPIYEFRCHDCDKHFETLVSRSTPPECPFCHGAKLEKQLSVFAVSDGSHRAQEAACGSCSSQGGCASPGSGMCMKQ